MADDDTPRSPEHEAAIVAKLQAETEHEAARIAHLQAETERQLIERRKLEAEAIHAEHEAAMAAITRRERERMEAIFMVQDHMAFHHLFNGPVSEKTVSSCLCDMNIWHRRFPDSSWELTINSPGGSVIDGMQLFDTVCAYSLRGGGTHHITITVRGYAASMASILLQAADLRRIGAESYIMVHEVSSIAGGKIGEIQDEVEFLKKISERVANIFVERSGGKTSLREFKKLWERKDAWLDSSEALRRGFVDEIG